MKTPHPEVKGFPKRNLQFMIQFKRGCKGLSEKTQRPVADFPEASAEDEFWPQPVAKFEAKDSTQPAQGSGETQIEQQVVAQLSWPHPVILSQKLKKNYFLL